MTQGDMVPIYIPQQHQIVDTTGIVIDIIGHKITILCDGAVESWNIDDLEKMAKWKKRHKKV